MGQSPICPAAGSHQQRMFPDWAYYYPLYLIWKAQHIDLAARSVRCSSLPELLWQTAWKDTQLP